MSGALRLRLATALWALAAAAWLAPLASGYFLSDDFVIFANLGQAEAKGALAGEAFAKFAAGLDVATSRFYRPLPHLTFVASYALFGAHATPWLLVNLAAHLAAAILVAVLAWQLAGDCSWRSIAAGLAGATAFLAFAPGLEAAAWVAARYDTFATLFALASCVAYLASRRAWDAAFAVSLAAFILAFLSKESAAVVPPAIVALALWRRRSEALSPGRRLGLGLADSWPWLALGVAYLLLRAVIFGSPIEVYAGSRPESFAFSPERWLGLASSFVPWLRAQFPDASMRLAVITLAIAMLALAVARAILDRDARPAALAVLALVGLNAAILAPHLGGFEADGSSGRLLHMGGAFMGVLAGLAGAWAGLRGAATVVAVLLAAVALVTGTAARDRWVAAHAAMHSIAKGIGTLHASLGPGEHALVIVPLMRGPIPFGLNAQAGLMLPPVQARPVSDRVLVQTAAEIDGTAKGYERGLIANLRRLPLMELAAKGAEGPSEFPTKIYCWSDASSALVGFDAPAPVPGPAWVAEVRAAMARRGCAAS